MSERRASAWARIARALALITLLGLAGSWASPARAQEPSPPLAEYEQLVREALAAAQRNDRLGLEHVAERLVAIDAVQTPDGGRVPVNNRWLGAALQDANPNFPRIAARLGALLDALTQTGAAPPDDAQAQLRDILSRPPFANQQTDTPSWFDDLLDWFFRLLARVFGPAAEMGQGASWLVGLLGIGLIGGVLIYWMLGLRRSLARDAHANADADPEAHLTANAALQQASTLAQGGDYRTAVRYLYLSALLWLEERGHLRYDRSLTNYEHLDRLGGNAELRDRLRPIIDTFDRVWYGYAQIDADRFAHYEQQIQALRQASGGSG